MSFGDSTPSAFAREEHVEDGLALETLTRNSLSNVQNSVRSLGDQIVRLTQSQSTPKTVSIMKSLISESSSTLATLENHLRQWKKAGCSDATTAARKKLVLPPLESGYNAEVEKLRRFQRMVETTEKQLKSPGLIDSFSLERPSETADATGNAFGPVGLPSPSTMNRFEVTDIPKGLFEANEQRSVAVPVGLCHPDQPTSVHDLSIYTGSEQTPSQMLPVVNSSSSRTEQSSRGQQICFSSNPVEFAPPVIVGRQFYDQADDDDDPASGCLSKKNLTSLSSTTTGRSRSPTSEEEDEEVQSGCPSSTTLSNDCLTPRSGNRLPIQQRGHSQQASAKDNFLEDDYLHQHYRNRPNNSEFVDSTHNGYCDNDDDAQEFSGLLARGSVRSASYLDGWHLTVNQPRQDDDLESYVSRERLHGVRRIKAQLSQISSVFRELAHLINEQQDDLDLIDSNIMNIKNSTGCAVDELRRANVLKQRARRRNCFMIFITLVVGAIVLFVYLLQSPSIPSYMLTTTTAARPPINNPRSQNSIHEVVTNNRPTETRNSNNRSHGFSGSGPSK